MKTGEKIALAAVILTIVIMLGGLLAFLYNADFSSNLEFHIKLNYFFVALVAISTGILYFVSFTKEGKK